MSETESTEVFERELFSTRVAEWRTSQAVVFDWFDGPREGVCSLANPNVAFYFTLLDERPTSDDLDDRLFRLSRMQKEAVGRIVAALEVLGNPSTPVWVPIWRFPDGQIKESVESIVNQLTAGRIETDVVIRTRNFVDILGCWLVPRDIRTANWFNYLGI